MKETTILGLKPIKFGQILNLKTGKSKITNIEYINIAVDRFDFLNRESLFCNELKNEMTEEEFNLLKENKNDARTSNISI